MKGRWKEHPIIRRLLRSKNTPVEARYQTIAQDDEDGRLDFNPDDKSWTPMAVAGSFAANEPIEVNYEGTPQEADSSDSEDEEEREKRLSVKPKPVGEEKIQQEKFTFETWLANFQRRHAAFIPGNFIDTFTPQSPKNKSEENPADLMRQPSTAPMTAIWEDGIILAREREKAVLRFDSPAVSSSDAVDLIEKTRERYDMWSALYQKRIRENMQNGGAAAQRENQAEYQILSLSRKKT